MRRGQMLLAAALCGTLLSGCGWLGSAPLGHPAHTETLYVQKTVSNLPLGGGAYSLSRMGSSGIAYAHGRRLSVSVDGGRVWHTTTFAPDTVLIRVAFSSASSGLVLGYTTGPKASSLTEWITTDGGRQWTSSVFRNLPPLFSWGDTIAFGANRNQVLLTSSPGSTTGPGPLYAMTAKTITSLPLPPGFKAYDARFVGTLLYVVGQDSHGGAVWVSRDDGQHFSQVLQSRAPIRGVAAHGSHVIVVGGEAGPKGLGPLATEVVYRSKNGGHSWTRMYPATGQPHAFSRVMWAGDGVGYALAGMVPMGANGNGYQSLWRTENGGRSWTLVLRGSRYVGGIEAHLLTPSGIFAVDNGVLLRSDNRGATWIPVPLGKGPEVLGMGAFSATGTPQIALVNFGTGAYALVRGRDGYWTLGPRIPNPGGFLADFVSPATGYLSTGTHLLVTRDGGQEFTPVNTPTGITGGGIDRVDFVSVHAGWVELMGRSGQDLLAFTRNGGQSWTSLGPVPMLAHLNFVNRVNGILVAVRSWAVTHDGGHHWTVHTLPPLTVVEAAAIKPDGSVWMVTERIGTAYGPNPASMVVTRPTGQVTTLPFPSTLTVSALQFPMGGNGTEGWMVANGNLYHSVDGGLRWTPVAFRLQGAVAVSGSGGV